MQNEILKKIKIYRILYSKIVGYTKLCTYLEKVKLMYRCGEYLEKVRSMYLCKSEVFFLPFQGAIRENQKYDADNSF